MQIIELPGDKSISHRALMLGAIATGKTKIKGFLFSEDCCSTLMCLQSLGVNICNDNKEIIVTGAGLNGLKMPSEILDVGNSGTTIRLMSGIIAGAQIEAILDGDASIRRRPMGRIIKPLLLMGANIISDNLLAPLHIMQTKQLSGIDYNSPISSAQVKSALLLAGLYADSETTFQEPFLSRNHSELMLKAFGADMEINGLTVKIQPTEHLYGQDIMVPADISSAAFIMLLFFCLKAKEILLKNVGVNKTRTGIIDVIKSMQGNIELIEKKFMNNEEVADILIKKSDLHALTIAGDQIPRLIDEIPAIAVLAMLAEGTTVIKDAEDLRKKESDRIEAISKAILSMGGNIETFADGFAIKGDPTFKYKSIKVKTFNDHRIAMAFSIAGLLTDAQVLNDVDNWQCVDTSFPGFLPLIQDVIKQSTMRNK